MRFAAAVERNVKQWLKRWLKQGTRLLPKAFWRGLLGCSLGLLLWGCTSRSQSVRLMDLPDVPSSGEVRKLSGAISEVAPPAIFLDLAELIADKQPQLAIASPKPNQTIDTTDLSVTFDLRGLSIYKDEELGVGPHLQLVLDNQPAQSIYSLEEPFELLALAPGSHTLRAFAVKPWGESFKNEGAYTQVTFHVFAQTGENTPNEDQPLLTFSEPQGRYGAEPILLDFYLNNAPLHAIAQADPDLADWRIRCNLNGRDFVFDTWQPIYLKGFKPGQNWVQLTLVDEQGMPVDNAFNSTVRIVEYDPNYRDTLAKLVRGELPPEAVGQIVSPDYEPPVEVPIEEVPSEEILIEDEPIEEILEEAPVEEAPSVELPVKELPATEVPAKELPPVEPVVPPASVRDEETSVVVPLQEPIPGETVTKGEVEDIPSNTEDLEPRLTEPERTEPDIESGASDFDTFGEDASDEPATDVGEPAADVLESSPNISEPSAAIAPPPNMSTPAKPTLFNRMQTLFQKVKGSTPEVSPEMGPSEEADVVERQENAPTVEDIPPVFDDTLNAPPEAERPSQPNLQTIEPGDRSPVTPSLEPIEPNTEPDTESDKASFEAPNFDKSDEGAPLISPPLSAPEDALPDTLTAPLTTVDEP